MQFRYFKILVICSLHFTHQFHQTRIQAICLKPSESDLGKLCSSDCAIFDALKLKTKAVRYHLKVNRCFSITLVHGDSPIAELEMTGMLSVAFPVLPRHLCFWNKYQNFPNFTWKAEAMDYQTGLPASHIF